VRRFEVIAFSFILISIISYGLYNSIFSKKSSLVSVKEETPTKRAKKIYKNIEKDVVAYIEDVINYGSNRFNFKGGEMEGGYIPKDKAKDVACFVYELSGKKCSKPYAKDASLYFSSSCAGCHGSNGKGLNGLYPDLTKQKLLGVN